MEFRLPELGEGVTEGELIKWKVKVGDQVKDDQPLCEVMTDKATIEIPSHFTGTVTELVAKEGENVKVHQLMLKAEAAGGAKASAPAPAHASPAPAAAKGPAPQAPATKAAPAATAPAKSSQEVLASPSTRRFARESGVELGNVSGTGPHGRVLRDDVQNAGNGGGASSAAAKMPARTFRDPAQREERVPIRGLRKKISEKMHHASQSAALFTYVEEADATELVKLRTKAKALGEKRGIKVSFLPFVMKAMVAALKTHPRINSTFDEATNELVTKFYYNISLSVQTEDGLTVPVIKHVDQKSVFELAAEIAQVVDRARKKKLTGEDFTDSTITLTNAGSIGGLFATPIINYPEVAILGFNKIARKPVVRMVNGKEKLAIRDWTYFSISLDHRLIDGADAAEFMKTFIEYIENPSLLILES
jgi:pyruvate dehydrogenase E2 component (dihydrolipoamide acetyltransferase)